MPRRFNLLSGEAVNVNVEDVPTVREVRVRVAQALASPIGNVKLSAGQRILKDGTLMSEVDAMDITVTLVQAVNLYTTPTPPAPSISYHDLLKQDTQHSVAANEEYNARYGAPKTESALLRRFNDGINSFVNKMEPSWYKRYKEKKDREELARIEAQLERLRQYRETPRTPAEPHVMEAQDRQSSARMEREAQERRRAEAAAAKEGGILTKLTKRPNPDPNKMTL